MPPPDPSASAGIALAALIGLSRALLLGGVLFLVLVVRPVAWLLADDAARLSRSVARVTASFGLLFVAGTAATLMVNEPAASVVAMLTSPASMPVLAGAAAALLIALLLAVGWAPGVLLLGLGAVVVAPGLGLAHAGGSPELLVLAAAHLLGAAIWIGGLPSLAIAYVLLRAGGWDIVAARFAPFAMLGGIALALSGAELVWREMIEPGGDVAALCTTPAGLLVDAKIVLFLALAGLGAANLAALRRLRRRQLGMPPTRMRRFGEVEIGLGVALFVTAAALAAAPMPQGVPSLPRLAAQVEPKWPHLTNPLRPPSPSDIVPATAAVRPTPSDTLAWTGVGVLAIGFLALLRQAGLRPAQHWPLVLLPIAALLFTRADPAAWPLGPDSLGDALADPAARPQQAVALLVALLGLIEWAWRAHRRRRHGGAALLLPLAALVAATALLATDATIPDRVAPALARTLLALLVLAAVCARWLDLRLAPYESRRPGWVWPVCTMFSGVLLIAYPIA